LQVPLTCPLVHVWLPTRQLGPLMAVQVTWSPSRHAATVRMKLLVVVLAFWSVTATVSSAPPSEVATAGVPLRTPELPLMDSQPKLLGFEASSQP
jgi:hypothetical protein